MATGPQHEKLVNIEFEDDGTPAYIETEPCRCVIGENHDPSGRTGTWEELTL